MRFLLVVESPTCIAISRSGSTVGCFAVGVKSCGFIGLVFGLTCSGDAAMLPSWMTGRTLLAGGAMLVALLLGVQAAIAEIAGGQAAVEPAGHREAPLCWKASLLISARVMIGMLWLLLLLLASGGESGPVQPTAC